MAAPAIVVERYRVEHAEGFTMPVISLTDRRAASPDVLHISLQMQCISVFSR